MIKATFLLAKVDNRRAVQSEPNLFETLGILHPPSGGLTLETDCLFRLLQHHPPSGGLTPPEPQTFRLGKYKPINEGCQILPFADDHKRGYVSEYFADFKENISGFD